MLVYAMTQEQATFIHYRNLRQRVRAVGDPALERALGLIAVDERSHHAFYARVVRLFLELDRAGTVTQLARVLHSFAMPAVHLLADSHRRAARIRALGIFNERAYVQEVYLPILEALGVHRAELRQALNR
jgi:acyl-[acyl-carrier-protein] desaturase